MRRHIVLAAIAFVALTVTRSAAAQGGVIADGKVRLVSEPSEGRVHDGGGEARKVSVITTFEFTVSGDDLSGTRKAAVAGEEMGGEGLPFKAVRERR